MERWEEEEKEDPFWRIGCFPLLAGLLCVSVGWLIALSQGEPPPNCDFSCAMAEIGWQDYLSLLLIGGGVVAFGISFLIWIIMVIRSFPGRRR